MKGPKSGRYLRDCFKVVSYSMYLNAEIRLIPPHFLLGVNCRHVVVAHRNLFLKFAATSKSSTHLCWKLL